MGLSIADFRAHADALGRIATQPAVNAADPSTSLDTKAHSHRWYPVSWELGPDGPDHNRPVLMACAGRNSKGRCSAMPRADEVGSAFSPTDRIFLQASKGVLKMIAGNGESTVVVNCGETKQQGYALISAKVLLGAAKVLRGKGDIDLTIDDKGATLRTGQGGKVFLPNVDTELPGYVRPEPAKAVVVVPAKFWPQMAKAVEAVSEKYWPFDHVSVAAGEGLTLSAAGETRMVEALLADQDLPVALGGVGVGFVRALKGWKDISTLSWGENVLMVESGPYTVATLMRRHHPGFPHRDLFDAPRPVVVEATSKVLADAVSLIGKEMIVVTAHEGALTLGAISVPVSHTGSGQVRVDAGLLGKLVKAWPGAKVRLSFGPDSPVTLEGDAPWVMRLAPVAM